MISASTKNSLDTGIPRSHYHGKLGKNGKLGTRWRMMKLIAVIDLARQLKQDHSAVLKALKKRKDISLGWIVSQSSGQRIRAVSAADGLKIVREHQERYTPGKRVRKVGKCKTCQGQGWGGVGIESLN